MVAAFVCWMVMALFFVGWGVYVSFSKREKPFGFWANAEVAKMKDVKGYNKSLGRLFAGFGVYLAIIGLPLLGGQNTPGVIISILGTMLGAIATMVIYVVVIEARYKK